MFLSFRNLYIELLVMHFWQLATGGGGGDIGKIINYGGGDGGDDDGDDDDYFDDFDDGDEGDEGGLFRRRILLQEVRHLIFCYWRVGLFSCMKYILLYYLLLLSFDVSWRNDNHFVLVAAIWP